MINENNTQQGENSIDQHGTNMKNMTTYSRASTNGTSNFSFGMTGNLSQLTPNLNAGTSPIMHNKDDKGRKNGNAIEQGQEQVKEKSDHSNGMSSKLRKEKRRSK